MPFNPDAYLASPPKRAGFNPDAYLQGAAAVAPTEAVDPTWQDRVGAALQGATFGFADELGTGVAAAAAKLAGSDEDYGDIYDQMMASEQAKRERYAEANPTENLLLNIAGGVGTGGVTLAKAVPAGLKGMKALLARTGVGVAEGAVAGAGSAEQGKRLAGAGEGAVMGGVLGGTLATAGAGGKRLLKAAGRRRVDRALGTGEDFVPINIADEEGALGRFYRGTVGQAFGGGDVLDQTMKVQHKAQNALDANTASMNAAAFKSALPGTVSGESLGDLPTVNPKKAMANITKAWNRDGFKEVKAQTFEIDDAQLMDEIFDAVDDPALRDKAGDVITAIEQKLSKHIKRAMVPPPKGQAYRSRGIGVGVERVPPTPGTSGTIAGDQLMEARNHFRRQINTIGDAPDARLKKAAYKKAANAIDKRIRAQLEAKDPAMLERFNAELSNYGKFNVLEKARAKAAGSEGKLIKPKQLLSAATTGRKQQAALETAPLQRLASDAVEAESGLKQAVQQAKSAAPPKAGGFNKLIQTAMLGAPMGGVNPMAIPAGALNARILSRPGTQRTLAGQTAPQVKLAEALRRYEGGPLQDVAGRLSTGARRGIITEQEQ